MTTHIPFTRLPGRSRLFLDYLYDTQHIGAFFAWPFRTGREFESCARLLDNHTMDREAIGAILRRQNTSFGADKATMRNIDRLTAPNALTVFTGQQVGLFGGPLYTIYKALGAIGWAGRLEKQLGRPVIPVFWLAADDHDFTEVGWTAFPNTENRPQRITYEPDKIPERIPTTQIILDDNIEKVHARRRDMRMETEFSAEVDAALADCYRPGVSLADAFGKWMTRVLAGKGLVLFSPADAEAKRLGAGLFERELRSPECTAQALDLVNLRVVESGYHLQVSHPPKNTHLFYFNGKRVPLVRTTDGRLTDGETEQSTDDWIEILRAHPDRFSPGVLFRPVLQNFLFPNIAYVGGPSEVTYWAQARALFEVFGVVQPVVLPRPFVTLVENNNRKVVERLELTLPDVLTDPETVVNVVARRTFSADLQELFAKSRECLTERLGELEDAVKAFEPTLEKIFKQGAGKISAELTTLEKKAFQAHKRKNEIIRQQVYKISGHLFPENSLQERVFGLPYYLNKYGFRLVDYLAENLELDVNDHQLLEIDL